jgi:hypothetical protein
VSRPPPYRYRASRNINQVKPKKMGTLKNAWATGSNRLGRGRIGKRAYPLRKVIARGVSGTIIVPQINGGTAEVKSYNFVRLECGHLQFPSSDFFGETGSLSQRCSQCYKEKQAEIKNPLISKRGFSNFGD